MKLYLLSQDDNTGYDTYDSAVVAASSKNEAVLIHPDGECCWDVERGGWHWIDDSILNNSGPWAGDWAPPGRVGVVLLGDATEGIAKGVICASFNAG